MFPNSYFLGTQSDRITDEIESTSKTLRISHNLPKSIGADVGALDIVGIGVDDGAIDINIGDNVGTFDDGGVGVPVLVGNGFSFAASKEKYVAAPAIPPKSTTKIRTQIRQCFLVEDLSLSALILTKRIVPRVL